MVIEPRQYLPGASGVPGVGEPRRLEQLVHRPLRLENLLSLGHGWERELLRQGEELLLLLLRRGGLRI